MMTHVIIINWPQTGTCYYNEFELTFRPQKHIVPHFSHRRIKDELFLEMHLQMALFQSVNKIKSRQTEERRKVH